MTRLHTERRGAALVVAIAVLTLLLAIALTFFTVSRLELKTVTNIENTVRAEFLADAALNIGISFLTQDTRDHPTVTSLDHAWRTYFNGAWIQGKLWAFPEQWAAEQSTGRFAGLAGGDVPTIFFAEEEGPSGSIAGGGGIGHVYYPRYEIQRNANNRPSNLQESAYTLDNNPFLVDPEGQRDYDRTQSPPFFIDSDMRIPAAYQVERWADIDNDGDGLRDSIWIPLASDTLVGNTVDGGTGEILFPGDGVDNNLNDDGSGANVDEPTETAVFLYYGGDDGLDNDNINTAVRTVDDLAEDRWFLTAPINSLDAASNFYLTLRGVYVPGMGAVDINTDPLLGWPNRWVDVLDNDYDLVHNKHFECYTPVGATPRPPSPYDTYPDSINPDWIKGWNQYATVNHLPIRVLSNADFDQIRGVQEISPRYLGDVANTWRVRSAGEPVSEIVGRAAILINDEASKVNVNVAGGNTLEIPEITKPGNSGPTDVAGAGAHRDYWTPATASAASTSQYCTRVLPQTGASDPDSVGRARKLWNLRMGAPNGGLEVRPADGSPLVPLEAEYIMDAFQPGYGLVDDNGNSLMLAMNGIDDDGDGMIDEGVNPAYPEYLGLFEGVDEPDEFQRLNPYRDLVAEGKIPMSDGNLDGTPGSVSPNPDNDRNGATNERGELGDRPLRTREETKRAVQTEAYDPSDSYYNLLKPFVTLHSTDKNNRFTGAVQYNPLLQPDPILGQADPLLRPSGLKLDYNYAPAGSIAQAFVADWGLASPTNLYVYDNTDPEAPSLAFATGLQQEGVNVDITGVPGQIFHSPIHFIVNGQPFVDPYPADPQLRALQLATNIVDGRDTDYARTTETMTVKDTWWEGESGGQQRSITYTVTGCEGIRITEMMVRPVRRVEAEMLKFLGPDSANPETGQTPYFCPNMFSQYALPQDIANPPNPFPFTEKPDFDMMRTYFEEMIPAQGSVVPSGYTGYWLQFADPVFFDDPNAKPVPPLQPPAPPYPYWYRNSQILPNVGGGDGVIGSDSVLTTTRATIPVLVRQFEDGRVVDERPEQWPNIIQFGFGPGPGLPPGKYYLTINTTTAQINPATGRPYVTVDDQARDQIRFAVKYTSATGNNVDMPLRSDMTPMTVGLQDILSDVRAAYLADLSTPYDFYNDPNSPFSLPPPDVSAPRVAGANPGEPPGWVFLPTVDAPSIGDGYGQDQAFTVTIPPYASTQDNQVYLYVAICPGKALDLDNDSVIDDGRVLAINFFDFSQEPDHEWVEIENVTGHAVDISGWTLTVGGVDKEGNVVTTERVDMQIPDHMTLDENSPVILESRPPNNRLILAVDAFDRFGKDPGASPERDYLGNPDGLTPNGIDDDGDGVADDGPADAAGSPEVNTTNGIDDDNDGYIDEPRINLFRYNGIGLIGSNLAQLFGRPLGWMQWDFSGISSPKPSNFNPWAWPERDYPGNPYGLTPNGIDDDGDGVIDDGPGDAAGQPETNVTNGTDDDNDGFIDDSATSPGICPFDNMYAARRVVEVEIEGLTNADAVTSVNDVAKWVLRGGVFPDYPEHDGIDNDNDNSILPYDGVDNNGDLVTLPDALGNPTFDGPTDGIDEGGYPMDAKQAVPPTPIGAPPEYWVPKPSPGGFNVLPVRFTSNVFPSVDPYFYSYNNNSLLATDPTHRNYLGSGDQPPEWKEFVERRFFPGDNVIVTLFEGSADQKRVVDRVTYNERDVINRATDDDLSVVSPVDGLTHLRHTLYDTGFIWLLDQMSNFWSDIGLPYYTAYWPDNTMMLDFCRTLERKYHPLYNGDRFGTSNRWEATDGNYDDWSHFPVAFNSPNFNGTPLVRNDVSNDPAFLVTAPNPALMNPEEVYLGFLSHALGDAPLDDFSGSVVSDNWAVNTGAWNLAGGALETNAGLIHYQGPPLPQTPTSPTRPLPYRENDPRDAFRWRDYQFTCDFKPLQSLQVGSVIGFVFRYGTDGNTIRYYRAQVTVEPDGSTWYRIVKHWGGAHDVVIPLVERAGPPLPVFAAVPDGQSPLLSEVRVEGSRISAIVNGVVLMTADTDTTYPVIADGSVGFYCAGIPAGGGVAFDNAYVTTRERNRPYTSPGDALAQPYLAFNRVFNYDSTSGEFSMGNDRFSPARDVLYMTEPQPVEPPRGLRMGDSYPLDVNAVVSTAATDRVLLTCGQANFHLLYPTSAQFPLNAADWAPLLNWAPPTQPGQPWVVPQVWRPAFLYALREPSFTYKYQIEGTDLDLTDQSPYTAFNFLFVSGLDRYNNVAPTDPLAWLAPNGLLSRYGYIQNPDGTITWRKDPRVVMYVSGNLASFDPAFPRANPAAANHSGAADATEALFEWNSDDGLENGQYDVYLDMGAYTDAFRDGDRGKLIADGLRDGGDPCFYYTNPQPGAGLLTPLGQALYGVRAECGITADQTGLFETWRPKGLTVDVEMFTDEDGDAQCWPGNAPTWNNLNRGTESFGQQQGLAPGPDGYIHYGVVRVKNNYLALHLRNWTKPGIPNRFLGVILTPRDRTSGRININTVETKVYKDSANGPTRLFNALMGVPGVLFDENQQYITPDGAPTPPRLEDLGLTTVELPELWPERLVALGIDPATDRPNLLDRARLIEVGRPGTRARPWWLLAPDWFPASESKYITRKDGRYYASLQELIGVDSAFAYQRSDTDQGLHPLTTKIPSPDGTGIPRNPQWYDEVETRFGKMANLITTRSDVFEILVTVQAGYAVDANGDGQINWRSNDEFIVTAEKKTRSVYER